MPEQPSSDTQQNVSPDDRKASVSPGLPRRTRRAALAALGLSVLIASGIVAALVVGWLSRGADQPTAGIVQTVAAGDLRITLQLDEAALGPRVIDVLVRDQANRPVPVSDVQLRFTHLEMEMSSIDAVAEPLSTGHLQSRGSFFSMAGNWRVEARILREGQSPLQAPFDLAIAAPGEASGPLNPLTPDDQTLATGRQLYQTNCAICHGDSGRGDGPAATGLNPRPGDFTQHMIPGKHTDGQAFLWIQNGYPGTAMPAWGQRLKDEQIWQLVIYLRAFGRGAGAAQTPQSTAQALPTQPATVSTASESLPPLVFVRQGNLWRSDGSPAAPQQLTSLITDTILESPTFSPDGSQIAFVTLIPPPPTATLLLPTGTLSVMDAKGGAPRVIWTPERGWLGLTTWTRDGQALYVTFNDVLSDPGASVTERQFQIVRVNPATGERQVVLDNARDPAFSRDGTQMAYLRWDQNNHVLTVHIAAPDGSGDRAVVDASAFSDIAAPRFSPDGKQILFAAVGGPVTDPQGYPINASSRSPVQGLLDLFAPPAAEAHGSPWDFWVVNADGGGLRRVTQFLEDSPIGIFSPDGQQVAIMSFGGIYLMNPDGSNLRKIDPLGDHGGLDWAPKSRYGRP